MFLSLLMRAATDQQGGYTDEQSLPSSYQVTTTPTLQWWIPSLLVLYSLLGNLAFVRGLQWGFRLFFVTAGNQTQPGKDGTNSSSSSSSHHHQQQKQQLQSRVSLAILLPTSFHVIAILVMIWENTTMVRRLACVSVLYYQYLATTVAMQLQLASTTVAAAATTTNSRKEPIWDNTTDTSTTTMPATPMPSRISFLLVFVMGLAVRSMVFGVLRGVVQSIDNRNNGNMEIPCILGLEASALEDLLGSSITFLSSSLSLCLG